MVSQVNYSDFINGGSAFRGYSQFEDHQFEFYGQPYEIFFECHSLEMVQAELTIHAFLKYQTRLRYA